MVFEKDYIKLSRGEFILGIVLMIVSALVLAFIFIGIWPECRELFIL